MSALRRSAGWVLLAALLLWPALGSAQIVVTASAAATVAETDANADFDVTLTRTGDEFTKREFVALLIAYGTASPDDLGNASSPSITFEAGEDTATFTLTITGDNLNEGSETFTIATLYQTTAPQTVTITDDDTLTISIGNLSTNVSEGQVAQFPLTFAGSNTSSTDLRLTFTLSGTGITADDFTYLSALSDQVATVPAGATTLDIAIAQDGATEVAETLTVTLSAASSIGMADISDTSGDETATVTIPAAAAHTYGITCAAAEIVETDADQTTTCTVSASAAVSAATTVALTLTHATTDGTSADDVSAPADVTIPAGQSTATATITIIGDNRNEATESFTLQTSGGGSTITHGPAATIRIADDDRLIFTMSGGGRHSEGSLPRQTAGQGGTGFLTLNLDFGAELTGPLQVRLDVVSGDGATPGRQIGFTEADTGTDWLPASPPLLVRSQLGKDIFMFQAGASSGSIPLNFALDDDLHEPDESFRAFAGYRSPKSTYITGTIHGDFTIVGEPQIFTIVDDDPITITLAGDSTVSEGSTASFTISIDHGPQSHVVLPAIDDFSGSEQLGRDVVIPWSVNELSDTDVIGATSGTVTFEDGTTNLVQTIFVPVGRSSTLTTGSPNETLTFSIGTVSGHHGELSFANDANTAASTVTWNNAAQVFSFTNPAVRINEGNSATYTVSRTGVGLGSDTINVMWAFTAGATAAADFGGGTAPAGGTLAFTADETSKTFSVSTAGDNLSEGNETFTLTLSVADATANGGISVPASGLGVAIVEIVGTVGTVIEIAFARGSGIAENVDEDGTVTFSVTLGEAVRTADLVVPFQISGLEESEFDITMPTGFAATATGGAITFAADGAETISDSIDIVLNLIGDTLNEASETLTIRGGEPSIAAGAAEYDHSGFGIPTNNASVTVTDDDAAAVYLTRRGSGAVPETAAATFTVSLRRAHASDRPLRASAADICVPFSVEVTGQQTPSNDADSGPDIALVAPHNGACGTRDTAVDPADSNGAATASVLIRAGQMQVDFEILARFDDIAEGATDETMSIALGAPVVADGGGSVVHDTAAVTAPITDLSAARALAVSATTASADEGGDLVFDITVTGADVSEAFSVAWEVTASAADIASASVDGTASPAATSGTLSFAAAASPQTRTLTLTTLDDALEEAQETVTLTISDPCPEMGVCAVGGRPSTLDASEPSLLLTTSSADGVIERNDQPVTLSLTAPAADLAEGTAADFTVRFAENITTTAPVTVDWEITFPAAAAMVNPANAGDFAPMGRSGSASIPTGGNSVTIPITALDETVNEALETFSVTLSNPAGGGAIAAPVLHSDDFTASANIAANDALVAHLSRTATTAVSEGAAATFTVTLRTGAAATDDAATSGGDICVPFSVEVTGQQTTLPAAANDADSGPDIALVAPHNGACAARGTPVVPADADGMATASVLVPAGMQSADFQIRARFDGIDEGATGETISITLGAPTARTGADGSGLTSDNSAVTAAIDNLNAAHELVFTSPAASIAEGASATFTVTRTGPDIASGESIVVGWTYAAGATNPAAAADFAGSAVPAGGDLTFTGSVTTQTFVINTREDTDAEPAESFVLALAAADSVRIGNGGVALPGPIDVLIGESDQPLTLSIAAPAADLAEDTAADFALSFSESVTTTEPVTVTWTISFPAADPDATPPVNPAATADFETLTETAMIPAGASSANISITAFDDEINEAAESFTITLSNPGGGGAIAAPVLHADDAAANADIAASDELQVRISGGGGVNEGDTATFTVTMRIPGTATPATSGGDVCIPFTVVVNNQQTPANTAANGPDIALVAPNNGTCAARETPVVPADADGMAVASVIIPRGSSSASFQIQARFDSVNEGDTNETMRVTISPPISRSGAGAVNRTNNTIFHSQNSSITNVNAARTLSIAATTASADEGDNLVFTAMVTGADVTEAFDVAWEITTDGDQVDGADSGTLRFEPGATPLTQTITLTATDDTAREADTQVTVRLTDPCLATSPAVCSVGGRPDGLDASAPTLRLTGEMASADINPSDQPVTLSVEPPASLTEGAVGNFTVRFTESITTTEDVTATWTISFPAAAPSVNPASAADFATLTGTATIPAGRSSAALPITPTDDTINEAAERFTLTLSSPAGGGAIAAPVLHSADAATDADIAASDDLTARIARSGPSGPVTEGGEAQFTVSLVLTGSTTPATSVAAICVTFATAVTQNTPAQGSNANTAENPDIAVRDCSGAAVSVMANGNSTGGGVLIPAGESSAAFSITARFDNEDEGSTAETLSVTLSAATHTPALPGAATLTADSTAATADIANSNSLRTLAVSAASVTGGSEDADAAGAPRTGSETAFVEFTAGITGMDLSEAVEVAWTLQGADGANLPGSAAASGLARQHGGDHTPDFGAAVIAETGGGTVNADGTSGTLSFPVGAPTTRTVRVPVLQDALNEGAERLTLTLTDPCPAPPAVCTAGGDGGGATPALQLTSPAQTATIPASDPITIFLALQNTGVLLPGADATYTMSFGTTMVNGQAVAIAPTTALTIPVTVTVGGTPTPLDPVTVAAGATTAAVMVPAATVNPQGQTGTPEISLAIGAVTGAPSGATVRAGTATDLTTQPDAPSKPTAAEIRPRQTAGWELTVTTPGGAQAPEGAAYRVAFALRGDADQLSANGLTIPWNITGRAVSGGRAAEPGDFAPSTSTPPAYTCGAPTPAAACTSFPTMMRPVTFTTGESSAALEIRIFEDDDDENMMPDGFTLTLGPLGGTDAGRTAEAGGRLSSSGTLPLEVTIPALRADLSIADAVAAEGASAMFTLSIGGISGSGTTSEAVTVNYRVGVDADGDPLSGDTAERGVDYRPPASGTASIAAGATSGVIAIPLEQDGLLETRETFTLVVTGASGGGGSIRLIDRNGNPANEISATGTITDDADQQTRRKQRVGVLVSVLDRQTATMATDAITERLSGAGAGGGAQLSIARRNLLGQHGSTAAAAQTAGDSKLGLALYGAAGLGGAAGGLPDGAGGRGVAGGGAFAGLGAGLAGGANMGSQTKLPSLAELMNGSRFAFQANGGNFGNLVEGLRFWGSGSAANLEGDPRGGSAELDYDGDTIAAFVGADRPVRENLLAGLALGWASGELDFTDRASSGGFSMSGDLSSDMVSVHPYLGWQVTPNLNAWLVVGFGVGNLDISETEGSGANPVSRQLKDGDSKMLMLSAGLAGQQQLGRATDLKLRLKMTQIRSEIEDARFDDGTLLASDQRSSGRLGGEAEVGHRFSFANGISLRPFGSVGLRFQNDSAAASTRGSVQEALDVGGGVAAAWPLLGLVSRAAFSLQVNDTGHEEQRASLHLNFDPGADSRGLTLAVQTALSEQRGGLLSTAAAAGGGGLAGGAAGSLSSHLASPLAGGAQSGMQRSISGELGYGMALRQFGRAALLTPYGRFNLGSADQRWAAGLRLAESSHGGLQLGLEAGLDLESTPTPSYDLLLTGRLRF